MPFAYSVQKVPNVGNHTTDRIIELNIAPGKTARDVTGLIDKQLFTGGNRLHAVQDSGLWYLKYDKGAVPGALQQRWTNFNILLKFVTNYFRSRNIEVKEVVS